MNFNEARKQPEDNRKQTLEQVIKQGKETASEIAGVTNLFVSFTREDKLGINPNSFARNTPVGIYAYPADYALKMMDGTSMPGKLPFVGIAPKWSNVFSVTGNIHNIQTMSDSSVNAYISQMGVVCEQRGVPKEALELIVNQSLTKGTNPDKPGGRLWYITWELAKTISKTVGGKSLFYVMWNRLFRDIGIDGLVDADNSGTVGHGIIHSNEPCQAMFLTTQLIERNIRVAVATSTPARSETKKLASLSTTAVIRDQIDSVGIKYAPDAIIDGEIEPICIRGLDPKGRERVIKHLPDMITWIERPTPLEQALAIIGDSAYMVTNLLTAGKLTEVGLNKAYELFNSNTKARPGVPLNIARSLGGESNATINLRIIAVKNTPQHVFVIANPATKAFLITVAKRAFASCEDEQSLIKSTLPRNPELIQLVSPENLQFAIDLVPSSKQFIDPANS